MKIVKTSNKPLSSKVFTKPSDDFYSSKAGKVISEIEELLATGQFRLRWDAAPCNFQSKRKYRGINLLLLAFAQMQNPLSSSKFWLTFNQANKLGFRIKKGEKSTAIVVWISKNHEVEIEDEISGEKIIVKKPGRMFSKVHNVFNLSQTDAEIEFESDKSSLTFDETLQKLKEIMILTDLQFTEGDNRAYYSPTEHRVNMPQFRYFLGESQELKEQFYLTTLCHEIAHSTMKLLRPTHCFSSQEYRDNPQVMYAKEEVVAEITAALLCATLGIEKQVLPDHAGYIRGWLGVAKKESPLFFNTACKLASEAHDFLMSKIDADYLNITDSEESIEDVIAKCIAVF